MVDSLIAWRPATLHRPKHGSAESLILWPIFAAKPWACSLREVAWKAEGFEGTKLRDIAAGHGARPVTALQTPGDAQQRVERRDLDPDQPRAPGMDGEFAHSRDRR